MKFKRLFNKPEYFFRPHQVARRLIAFGDSSNSTKNLNLFGKQFQVNPRETIGKSLVHMGVYDLALSEALWRLVSPGSRVLDIGANVGYVSRLLAVKVGSAGEVHSFEPHPVIFHTLEKNLFEVTQCRLYPVALSSKAGVLQLHIPNDFEGNEGIASLEKMENSRSVDVRTQTLDELFPSQKIDWMKIDVEGHELAVLEGGEQVLANTNHLIFEDFFHSKSPVIHHLRQKGFSVFRVYKEFLGPRLCSVEEGERLPLWEPANYIATRTPEAIQKSLQPRGWQVLQSI